MIRRFGSESNSMWISGAHVVLLSKRLGVFTRKMCLKMITFKFLLLSSAVLILFVPICKTFGDFFSSADDKEEYRYYSEEYFQSWPGYHVRQVESFTEDLPIIVWWTDGGNLSPHREYENKASYAHLTCPNGAVCYSSTDRSPNILGDPRTRGFLFYGTDFEPHDLPLPRLKHHEWALVHEESPLNNYMLCHYPVIRLFNHTSTFRRESDYPLSTQAVHQLDYLISRKPVSTSQKNDARKSRGLASVVYVQSHCDVPSDRDSYVKELMKFIDIDSYGSCLHNKDLPEKLLNPADTFEHNDFLDLLSMYKFNLAFENAYCNDYMTEKIMRPLHIGTVPVYKGSPVILDWMPNNHSVILVDDFKSPKELADYLKYLDENDEEYEKYLEFKSTEIRNKFLLNELQNREWSEGMKDFFRGYECYLCKQLKDRMETEKIHAKDPAQPLLPPRMANNSHLGCPLPQRLDIGQGIKDNWPEIDWTSMYWSSMDTARAVQRMLQAGESDSQKFDKYFYETVELKK